MSPSRWPRSRSHGKCSRKFCALSRYCGRSHHQRQHETFDSHAFKSKPREGVCPNVNEDGQIRPSTSFGEPAMPGAIHASHSCFQVIQKSATVHVRPRFIRGIPEEGKNVMTNLKGQPKVSGNDWFVACCGGR